METILKVRFPEEAVSRYGLEKDGIINFEDLRRRWAAEEAQKALGACREAASDAALADRDLRSESAR